VAAFLAGPLGMPRDRLRVRGLGESAPRAPNAYPDGSDYPEGRQANRRVEIFLRTGAAPACADRAAGFRPFTGVRPQRAVPRPPPARRIDPGRW
jgi:hypothetical protein